jgi:RNase P/RNase MRP subunit p29
MNDALGNSSGRVTSFTKNGLEITQKDEVITLVVRNKGSR